MFRRHTLLPLDDCLYALQPSIPHLTGQRASRNSQVPREARPDARMAEIRRLNADMERVEKTDSKPPCL